MTHMIWAICNSLVDMSGHRERFWVLTHPEKVIPRFWEKDVLIRSGPQDECYQILCLSLIAWNGRLRVPLCEIWITNLKVALEKLNFSISKTLEIWGYAAEAILVQDYFRIMRLLSQRVWVGKNALIWQTFCRFNDFNKKDILTNIWLISRKFPQKSKSFHELVE